MITIIVYIGVRDSSSRKRSKIPQFLYCYKWHSIALAFVCSLFQIVLKFKIHSFKLHIKLIILDYCITSFALFDLLKNLSSLKAS